MKFNEKLESYISLVNKRLNALMIASSYGDETVCDAMRYSVENGGKRIRPVLVLESCAICGGNINDALDIACALEMIHTYSLIHDDLPCMDNDDMRRGKPSCHVKFGEEYALLAGDALLTYAFEVVANSGLDAEKIVRCINSLSRNSGFNGMVGGQLIDLKSEGHSISYERLLTMHALKTGCLIRCAAELGCICAGADKETAEKLAEYASSLGLAFQVVDDILDVTGSAEKLGKPIGSDAESEKTTFVTLFGLEKSRIKARELTEKAIKSVETLENNNFLLELANTLSVREK